jgi:hypothetical protein
LLEARVGGSPGRREPLELVAVLDARSIGSVLVVDTYLESGKACCRASTCIAQAVSEIA